MNEEFPLYLPILSPIIMKTTSPFYREFTLEQAPCWAYDILTTMFGDKWRHPISQIRKLRARETPQPVSEGARIFTMFTLMPKSKCSAIFCYLDSSFNLTTVTAFTANSHAREPSCLYFFVSPSTLYLCLF